MPHIVSIVYKPARLDSKPADHFAREPVESVELRVGHGIVGDTKGTSSDRQLNIMRSETMAELNGEGFRTKPGELGEQIAIAGFSAYDLHPGVQIRIGDTAVVELVTLRTGCGRFAHIQGFPASKSAGRIGFMARVVADGTIGVGTSVEIA